MARLNYKNIEKVFFLLLSTAAAVIALYYFVFGIDWINLYRSDDDLISIAALNESCIQCHGNVKGFSESHNPKKIGCAACHLGNPKSRDKVPAHEGMIAIPGNSEDAKSTCGKTGCHPGIPERIDSSLMSSMSGVISVNKFAFEEINVPSGKYHIMKIGKTPSESHLRNLCASCHLGNEKNEFGPITELSRGGGCNACHLNYSSEALEDFKTYNLRKLSLPDSALIEFHPSLSLNITNDHCFGCHSRSGRISTNYEGWHETDLTKVDMKGENVYRELEDGRIFEFIKPDIHFEKGLVCVDCHISYEIMGDGTFYEHKEEQIIVQCIDCHSHAKQEPLLFDEFDIESQRIAELLGYSEKGRKFIKLNRSDFPLVNSFFKNGKVPSLVGKQSKKRYDLNPPKSECISSRVHKSVSCSACHTAWAPQCIGCHTEFQPGTNGFDLLENKDTDSAWVEYHGEFLAELPTLGIIEEKRGSRHEKWIKAFIPGMIMTIDKSEFKDTPSELVFKRLFAPVSPHTIRKESRSCESCHNDPLAIGYGRGNLEYIVHKGIGRWLFEPKFNASEFDTIPEDGWIGFLTPTRKNSSTRENARPFNIEEQKRILRYGACLTCHNSEEFKRNSLSNYEEQLDQLSRECVIPTWN